MNDCVIVAAPIGYFVIELRKDGAGITREPVIAFSIKNGPIRAHRMDFPEPLTTGGDRGRQYHYNALLHPNGQVFDLYLGEFANEAAWLACVQIEAAKGGA